jgi:hypothetical protein
VNSHSPPPPVTHPSIDKEVVKRASVYRAISNIHEETTYSSVLERKATVQSIQSSQAVFRRLFRTNDLESGSPTREISSTYTASNIEDSVYTADTAKYNQATSQHENSIRTNVFNRNRPDSVPKALRTFGVIPSAFVN